MFIQVSISTQLKLCINKFIKLGLPGRFALLFPVKMSVRENKRGYRLILNWIWIWSLLILLLSVAYKWRKCFFFNVCLVDNLFWPLGVSPSPKWHPWTIVELETSSGQKIVQKYKVKLSTPWIRDQPLLLLPFFAKISLFTKMCFWSEIFKILPEI